MVVSVQLDDVPAERAPLCAEILQLQRLFAGIEALHMVMVDDSDQIFEPVLVGKQRCLPDRAFVALAVAQYGKHPVMLAVLLRGQCHPGRGAETVAQGAGGKVHAGQMVRDVAGQAASVLIMCFQLGGSKEAAFCERGIYGGAGMALCS